MSKNKQKEKEFTQEEIKVKIDQQGKILIILFEGVYDMTKFADLHPGGDEILKEYNGKNGTQKFVELGHLNGTNIISTLAKMRVGKFKQKKRQAKL